MVIFLRVQLLDLGVEEAAREAAEYLEKMAASLRADGFKVRAMVEERPPADAILHVADHEASQLEEKLRVTLFEHEQEVDPVTIVILLDIFRKVGQIAGTAENVSDALRSWIETR